MASHHDETGASLELIDWLNDHANQYLTDQEIRSGLANHVRETWTSSEGEEPDLVAKHIFALWRHTRATYLREIN